MTKNNFLKFIKEGFNERNYIKSDDISVNGTFSTRKNDIFAKMKLEIRNDNFIIKLYGNDECLINEYNRTNIIDFYISFIMFDNDSIFYTRDHRGLSKVFALICVINRDLYRRISLRSDCNLIVIIKKEDEEYVILHDDIYSQELYSFVENHSFIEITENSISYYYALLPFYTQKGISLIDNYDDSTSFVTNYTHENTDAIIHSIINMDYKNNEYEQLIHMKEPNTSLHNEIYQDISDLTYKLNIEKESIKEDIVSGNFMNNIRSEFDLELSKKLDVDVEKKSGKEISDMILKLIVK